MFKSPLLIEQARRERGEEQAQSCIRDDYRFKRAFLEDVLLWNWGKTWSAYTFRAKETGVRPPVPDGTVTKYPFSDQSTIFSNLTSPFLRMLPWKSSIWNKPYWKSTPKQETSRVHTAKTCFKKGTTVYQRFFAPLYFLFYELYNPITQLVLYFVAVIARLYILIGFGLPLLWWYYAVFRFGCFGKEFLPPGENGYTKIFRGGEDINLDELESELMARNSDSGSSRSLQDANIIAISYKHYANKGKVPGDDGRICRTDLQALAMFIKAAGPCDVQFWIDAKLPLTSDASFERWINRGVRPYGRYITFVCPSPMEYAESSFWLANERLFAVAAKGVMYVEGDQIYYELSSSFQNNTSFHQRLLHVIISAENSPVQVRDEDKSKVINWAMCCLRGTDECITQGISPSIDKLEMMVGEVPHDFMLVKNITNVIRAYGPQELPVIPGRCWNEKNPCLLGDASHQEFDFSSWLGFSYDGSPTRIYFLHHLDSVKPRYPTFVVLEVTLNKPHFNPGKIRVIRKVLREIESSILLECKVVTLPWLCEWE